MDNTCTVNDIDLSNYPVSKQWDMDISFEKLIRANKYCKIERIKNQHIFETFNGLLINVTHPNSNTGYSIEIGVTDDRFIYEGDGCCNLLEIVPIKQGLDELMKFREKVLQKQEQER